MRVAHLDTGYDPEHPTRPLGLRTDLGRNFAGGDPGDATDPGRRGLAHAPTLRQELAAEVPYFAPLAGGDPGEYGIPLEQGR